MTLLLGQKERNLSFETNDWQNKHEKILANNIFS